MELSPGDVEVVLEALRVASDAMYRKRQGCRCWGKMEGSCFPCRVCLHAESSVSAAWELLNGKDGAK